MYNSSGNTNQNDTIIDESLLYGRNDESRSNSAGRRTNQARLTKSNDTHGCNYVEHARLEAAKQIEQILNFYRKELKQESNTQLECNQQLITRLVDFIRPAYSSQRKKMEDLDELYEDIFNLQYIRFIEQKEKMEQLSNEILHLKKWIIKSAHEDDDSDRTAERVYRIDSMVNYQQWMELEEETKTLYNLVETQRDRIDELIKLLNQEDETSVVEQRPTIFDHNPERTNVRTSTDEQQGSGYNFNRSVPFQSIRTCPLCQAIFNELTMTEEQFQQHIKAHVYQKRR